ncbi:MAG: glycoside hydrolase family 3 C-terminal domain-containing protein, partial [Bacilli bacterium]|nr:glycoside hydrolase family 3 C-terminal domain-containing protein [Bacilli bacterium]
MSKKKISLAKVITLGAISVVLSAAMAVGTSFALKYEPVLNTYFQRSDYKATDQEKDACQEVVRQGTVLLKNDDSVLPLGTGEKRLAIFGENSVDFVYGGSGSGAFDTSLAPTLKEALEDSNHGGFTVDSNLWNFYENGAGKDYRKTYPDETGAGSFAVNEVPIDVLKNDTLATSTLVGDDVALVCL